MEELFESDVLWPENHQRTTGAAMATSLGVSSNIRARARQSSASSAPMNIPTGRRVHSMDGCGGDEEEGEMVPPHILMSRRRMAGKVAFSLCSGQGRTLKGRDLSHVRNSVLRMTGFLEG